MHLAIGSATGYGTTLGGGVGTTLGGGVGTTLGGAAGWLVRERVRWAIGSAGSRVLGWRDTLGDTTTGTVSGMRTLGCLAGLTLGWVKAVFGLRGDVRDSCLGGVYSFVILGSRGWIQQPMACLRALMAVC